MDLCDECQPEIDNYINQCLAKTRSKPPMTPTGFCLYCDEETENNKPFCNNECRDEYDKEQKLNRIRGIN